MKDKVILVTGANRGIGLNIIKRLDSDGYTVIGTSRTDDGANIISQEIKTSNGKGLKMDVTDQESINSAIKKIQDEYGTLYGLVNNAGITNDNLLMRMTEEQWLSVIETNLTSIYRVTKSIIKDMMKARNGRIVNIGSIVGMMGNSGQSNYSASKSGLLGFTKSLARELTSRNINVNSISPGFIDTDMTKTLSDEQIDNLTGPSAQFTSDATFGNYPLVANFTSNSIEGTHKIKYHLWQIEDESIYATENLEYTFNYPGTYNASLIVIDEIGQRDTTMNETIITVDTLFGDANFDAQINTVDVEDILIHSIGNISFDAAQVAAGDLDNDDTLSPFDASLILQYLDL